MKFYHKLNFNSHIPDLCKKASYKVNSLPLVAPYMDIAKKRIFMNAFLSRNLGTALSYGCARAVKIMKGYTNFMKDVSE